LKPNFRLGKTSVCSWADRAISPDTTARRALHCSPESLGNPRFVKIRGLAKLFRALGKHLPRAAENGLKCGKLLANPAPRGKFRVRSGVTFGWQANNRNRDNPTGFQTVALLPAIFECRDLRGKDDFPNKPFCPPCTCWPDWARPGAVGSRGTGSGRSAAPLDPEEANSLVIAARRKDFQEPAISSDQNWLAKWKKLKSREWLSFRLPPSNCVIGSQFDYEYMEPLFTTSVFEKTGSPIVLSKVADMVKGNITMLTGFDSLESGNDSYLVKLSDNVLASYAPANRQAVICWLQNQPKSTGGLSPYLSQAAKFADENADVIISFDMQHVLDPSEIAKRIQNFESLKGVDADTAVKVLETLQGLTLGITVKSGITGSIKIDFTDNPMLLTNVAKAFLLEALGKRGLMIDDFENWELKHSNNQFLMSGPLSPAGLRQISLLINHPLREVVSASSTEGGVTQTDMGTSTKQYYDQVNQILEDFRSRPQVKNLNTYASWFDRFARKIDELPVLNVDDAMIQFGQSVSNQFRDISTGLRAELTKTQDATSYQNSAYGYRGYYGSYSYYYDNSKARNAATSIDRQAGSNQARACDRGNCQAILGTAETNVVEVQHQLLRLIFRSWFLF
jgi:hypothetical protein